MEDFRVSDLLFVHFFRAQHQVCPRFPVEAELPVAARQRMHEGKRRRDPLIAPQTCRIHAEALQGPLQLIAEGVSSDLADKGTAPSELREHGQDIGRRAARIGLKQGIALRTDPVLHQVDQQFADSRHIRFLCFHLFSSQSSAIRGYSFPSLISMMPQLAP